MKKIFLLILFACLSAACNKQLPTLTDVKSGELDELPVTEFVLTEPNAGANPLIVTVTWSKTKFYLDGEAYPVGNVKYTIEADIAGARFANAVTLAAPDNNNPLAANLFVNDVNSILINNFKAMAKQQLQLELRLRTEYGENGEKNFVYSTVPLALTLVPFRPENELIPVYLTGDVTGGDLNSRAFMMYRADNDPKNHEYTYTGKFGANTHFKFCSEIALGDESKMFGNGGGNMLVIGGSSDMVIENEGIYTLTMNDKTLTYSITPYTGATTEYDVVNFVGAFCEWGASGEDPEMQNFVVGKNGGGTFTDRHNWYLEIDLDNIEYGVKFRANHGWENRWCPIKSTDNPFGITELNPTQDPNIDITQQGLGHYEVRFNDLTGHYFVKVRTL